MDLLTMPLYRVIKSLSFPDRRVEAGGLINLSMSADKIEILERSGAISRLHSPPISEVPGWADRAAKLPGNIQTIEHFLEASDETLAAALKVKPGEVPRLKQVLQDVLFIPGERPCNCS